MSDLIIWSPSMSVGVDILDDDHKRIMVLINKLHEAMLEGKGKKLLGEIFDGLIAYIKLHFDSEEAL
ncbi:MAG TPA: hemerythrin, partial [Rhodospirillaceae bacterium]|nr:hemerythrin [Rhodospirillaceae bacterium]